MVEIKDYFMESRDKLKLHALSMQQEEESHKWAVICHGYSGEASEMQSPAYHFYKEDYNIIMPDARGHGSSEGAYIGMGWGLIKLLKVIQKLR